MGIPYVYAAYCLATLPSHDKPPATLPSPDKPPATLGSQHLRSLLAAENRRRWCAAALVAA
jgi:hypothetical protein